jgi:plasmid maintenance system antidote protein VapI
MNKHENLVKWMEENELNYSALAEQLDLHKSYVSLIVNGLRPINNSFKWRFGSIYGFDKAVALFGEIEEPVNA